MRPSEAMRDMNLAWLREASKHNHLFHYAWQGGRFFHLPADMLALQELLWRVRPRTVVATGIAAGGGPVFLASMLAGLGEDGEVIAIDPVFRDEARDAIAKHPAGSRVRPVVGSSVDDVVARDVSARVKSRAGPVLVVLDLTHTHAHVLRELELYAPLATPGSYVVVMDTIMEDLPAEMFEGKPYGRGNNPGTAARAYLQAHPEFEVDREIEDRVLITLAPGGFLRRREG